MSKIKNIIHGFESDPFVQFKFHSVMACIWLIGILTIPFIPALYGHGIAALIIEEISLYANFATEYGSMSAAIAAQKGENNVKSN